jgi:hypothetical protein
MRHAIVHATAVASFCVEAVGTGGVAKLDQSRIAERVAAVRRLITLET